MALTLNVEVILGSEGYTTMLQDLEEVASVTEAKWPDAYVLVVGTKGTVIRLCSKIGGEITVERLGEL